MNTARDGGAVGAKLGFVVTGGAGKRLVVPIFKPRDAHVVLAVGRLIDFNVGCTHKLAAHFAVRIFATGIRQEVNAVKAFFLQLSGLVLIHLALHVRERGLLGRKLIDIVFVGAAQVLGNDRSFRGGVGDLGRVAIHRGAVNRNRKDLAISVVDGAAPGFNRQTNGVRRLGVLGIFLLNHNIQIEQSREHGKREQQHQ